MFRGRQIEKELIRVKGRGVLGRGLQGLLSPKIGANPGQDGPTPISFYRISGLTLGGGGGAEISGQPELVRLNFRVASFICVGAAIER